MQQKNKNSPANESGCADLHGEGCDCGCSYGCSCVLSGGRASSFGVVHGATLATWTGDRRGDGSRRDLGTCRDADWGGCDFESETESGSENGAIEGVSRERADVHQVHHEGKGNGNGRMGHLDLLRVVDLRYRHFGSDSGSGLIGEEDCGYGFVLGDSTIENESV